MSAVADLAMRRHEARYPNRIDGERDFALEANVAIRHEYKITQQGVRGHAFSRGDGADFDPGVPHMVKITGARLVLDGTVLADMPLTAFDADVLAEREQVIADELDQEQ